MENITKKLHIKRGILVLIILLWMGIVFFLSNENGNESNNTSSFVVNIIINMYENMTNNTLDISNIEIISFVVRKIAHFTLYFIGAIPVYMLFKSYDMNKRKIWFYSILFCFIYACSDEIHQLFSAGRDGKIMDVLIDTSGSIVSVICLEFISYIICKFKNKKGDLV